MKRRYSFASRKKKSEGR